MKPGSGNKKRTPKSARGRSLPRACSYYIVRDKQGDERRTMKHCKKEMHFLGHFPTYQPDIELSCVQA